MQGFNTWASGADSGTSGGSTETVIGLFATRVVSVVSAINIG